MLRLVDYSICHQNEKLFINIGKSLLHLVTDQICIFVCTILEKTFVIKKCYVSISHVLSGYLVHICIIEMFCWKK